MCDAKKNGFVIIEKMVLIRKNRKILQRVEICYDSIVSPNMKAASYAFPIFYKISFVLSSGRKFCASFSVILYDCRFQAFLLSAFSYAYIL